MPAALISARLPRQLALVALMVCFILGNLPRALAPGYGLLMASRVIRRAASQCVFRDAAGHMITIQIAAIFTGSRASLK